MSSIFCRKRQGLAESEVLASTDYMKVEDVVYDVQLAAILTLWKTGELDLSKRIREKAALCSTSTLNSTIWCRCMSLSLEKLSARKRVSLWLRLFGHIIRRHLNDNHA